MAREDLNPVEEARAVAELVDELGVTKEDIGRRIGRSRVAVSNLLRLLDLPDEALDLLERALSAGHGRAILTAPDHAERRRLAREAAAQRLDVRETEAAARGADSRGEIRARRLRGAHPDQIAAAERLGDAFGRALGADVSVTPRRRATGSRSRSRRWTRRSRRPPGSASRRPERGRIAIIATLGRLAQSVRALL